MIAPKTTAWSNRGDVLYDLKRWPEVLGSYDRAIAVRPELAEAHLGRGDAVGFGLDQQGGKPT